MSFGPLSSLVNARSEWFGAGGGLLDHRQDARERSRAALNPFGRPQGRMIHYSGRPAVPVRARPGPYGAVGATRPRPAATPAPLAPPAPHAPVPAAAPSTPWHPECTFSPMATPFSPVGAAPSPGLTPAGAVAGLTPAGPVQRLPALTPGAVPGFSAANFSSWSEMAAAAAPPPRAGAAPAPAAPPKTVYHAAFLSDLQSRLDLARAARDEAAKALAATVAAAEAKRNARSQEVAVRMAEAAALKQAIEQARAGGAKRAWAAREARGAALAEERDAVQRLCERQLGAMEALIDELPASAEPDGAASSVPLAIASPALKRRLGVLEAEVHQARTRAAALQADAARARSEAASALSSLHEQLWVPSTSIAGALEGSREHVARTFAADGHAELAPLVRAATALVPALGAIGADACAVTQTTLSVIAKHIELAAIIIADLRAAEALADSRRVPAAPTPAGSRRVGRRALTATESAAVADALAPGAPSQLLAEYQDIPVTRQDMATLRNGQWLNDEVINLWCKLLQSRSTAQSAATGTPKCYVVQSNFYTKLAESASGYCYSGVKRWTKISGKKIDVFGFDFLLFPIHCGGNHWTLAVVNLRDERFEYYDSLRGAPHEVLSNLRRWLSEESLAKRECEIDLSAWVDVSDFGANTPRQMNGSDCGVFMTRTADYLSRDAVLDFTQEHMPYFRQRMVAEILEKALFADDPEDAA